MLGERRGSISLNYYPINHQNILFVNINLKEGIAGCDSLFFFTVQAVPQCWVIVSGLQSGAINDWRLFERK